MLMKIEYDEMLKLVGDHVRKNMNLPDSTQVDVILRGGRKLKNGKRSDGFVEVNIIGSNSDSATTQNNSDESNSSKTSEVFSQPSVNSEEDSDESNPTGNSLF